MKVVALIDSQVEIDNENRLLNFITNEYSDLFALQTFKINEVPALIQNEWQKPTAEFQQIKKEVQAADGLIILIEETTETLSPALKASIQWLGENQQAFKNKPILVMTSSYYTADIAASQLYLRQLLEDPSVGAYTFPGNDFFLGEIAAAINTTGEIKNNKLVDELRRKMKKYIHFIQAMNEFSQQNQKVSVEEDLYATGSIETTIAEIEMDATDWVEQAAAKVEAVTGDTYVQLDRGILTVDQLNAFLTSMPMELTFMDANNQFVYYNYHLAGDEMLASTYPEQVGSPVGHLHPEAGHARVKMLIQQLRSGQQDIFKVHVPTHGPDKFVVHHYTAMKNHENEFMGVNEFVLDYQPIIDWYLKQTNQQLSKKPGHTVDAVSGTTAKKEEPQVDAVSSATKNS